MSLQQQDSEGSGPHEEVVMLLHGMVLDSIQATALSLNLYSAFLASLDMAASAA